MSLNLHSGAAGGRWAGMVPLIKEVGPQVLMIQEADGWDGEDARRLRAAGVDLGMRGQLAPSRTTHPTGILLDESRLTWGQWITTYNHAGWHGHSELQVTVPGLPVPLVLISAHLSPYSAFTAAQEAAVLVGRAHRARASDPAGGYGIVAGDINHIPPGDQPPPWDQLPPHDRVARGMVDEDGNRRPNTIVGRTLADGSLVDVAAHLADQREDPDLRAGTGRDGTVRIDQIHITDLLLPALKDYWTVPMGDLSDHDGVVARLDLDLLDA